MPILQSCLPYTPWSDAALRRMPGLQPVAAGDWLQIDDAYAAQLTEKARLIGERPDDVLALDKGARAAGEELLSRVVDAMRGIDGLTVATDAVTRPGGEKVALE